MFITAVCLITFYILSIFWFSINSEKSEQLLLHWPCLHISECFGGQFMNFLLKKKMARSPSPWCSLSQKLLRNLYTVYCAITGAPWQFVYFCTRPGEGFLIRSNKRKEWQNFFGATFMRLLLQKATFDFFEQVLSTRATCGLLVLNIPRYAIIFSPNIFRNRSTFYLSIHVVSPKWKPLITELPEMILDPKM